MIWKETGEVIGTAGLQPLENTEDTEVGYSVINRSGAKASQPKPLAAGWSSGLTKRGFSDRRCN